MNAVAKIQTKSFNENSYSLPKTSTYSLNYEILLDRINKIEYLIELLDKWDKKLLKYMKNINQRVDRVDNKISAQELLNKKVKNLDIKELSIHLILKDFSIKELLNYTQAELENNFKVSKSGIETLNRKLEKYRFALTGNTLKPEKVYNDDEDDDFEDDDAA